MSRYNTALFAFAACLIVAWSAPAYADDNVVVDVASTEYLDVVQTKEGSVW